MSDNSVGGVVGRGEVHKGDLSLRWAGKQHCLLTPVNFITYGKWIKNQAFRDDHPPPPTPLCAAPGSVRLGGPGLEDVNRSQCDVICLRWNYLCFDWFYRVFPPTGEELTDNAILSCSSLAFSEHNLNSSTLTEVQGALDNAVIVK